MKTNRFIPAAGKAFSPTCIEPLEARIAPAATISVALGALTYTGGLGANNALTLSISGANYVFNDTGETIDLTAAAIAAGFTGGGTNTVQGPNTAVSSISVLLGGGNDQFLVQGLTDPLAFDGESGADSVSITGAATVGGALSLTAETITISQAVSAATTVIFTADTMTINAAIQATTSATLQPLSALGAVDVGTKTAGKLSLTDAELDRFTTPVIRIGDPITTGDISISAAIDTANTNTMRLSSAGAITETAAGTITEASLRVRSTGTTTLTGANNVGTLAANVFGGGTSLFFANGTNPLTIDSADGQPGISAPGVNVTIFANSLNVSRPVNGNLVTLQPFSASSDIDLGAADSAGVLGLTDTELDLITANVLRIGTLAGTIGITVSAAISPANVNTLSLISNDTVTETAGGSIVVANLAISSKNGVTLTNGANDVGTLAAKVTAAAATISFRDANGLIIGTVDGISGLMVATSASGENITLRAGATTQASGANILSNGLELLGAGPFTLDNTGNRVTVLAANVTGALRFTDSDGVNVGSIGATTGVSTSNSSIRIATVDGNIVVLDTATGADVNAGTSTVNLTAGGAAGQDRAITINANAGVTGTGGVTLVADNMGIAATVSGGSGGVVVQPFEGTTAINLGGADAAGSLGLTDAELDFLSGARVTIGGGTGTLTVSAALTPALTGALELIANAMTINQTISVNGVVSLKTFTAGRLIDLGTKSAGNLGFTDTELDRITASSGLRIGDASTGFSGGINFSAVVSPANASTLTLSTLGNVTRSGTGSVQVANLAVSGNGVNLNGSQNQVGTISGIATGNFSNAFAFTNSGPLAVGTVDGVVGITTTNGGITLIVDTLDIQQAVNAGTRSVVLLPVTGARTINLGTDTGGLDLTDSELDRITAGILQIGQQGSNPINVSSAVTPLNVSTLRLGGDTLTGVGSIRVANLIIDVAQSVSLTGTNDVDFLTITSSSQPGSITFADASGFSFGVPNFGATLARSGFQTTTFNVGNAAVAFRPEADLYFEIFASPTQLDKFVVTGTVTLAGAAATFNLSDPLLPDTEYIILSNDGTDRITGTFAGIAEGGVVISNGQAFRVSYVGGDGNDISLRAVFTDLTFSADKRSAFYTDVDGDKVTISVSKGKLDAADFTFVVAGTLGGSQLQRINLSDDGGEFKNANLTANAITPSGGTGDGVVNIGAIDSTGRDLGKVKVSGDLGQIDVGDGDPRKPALLKLKVGSMGLNGNTTQPIGTTGPLASSFDGNVSKLVVKTGIKDATLTIGGTLNVANITGDIDGSGGGAAAGLISVGKNLGTLTVTGNVKGGATASGIIAGRAIGTVTITGDLISADPAHPVVVSAFGKKNAVTSGVDLAIGTLNVLGNVDHARILAGYDLSGAGTNADASIGLIRAGLDWTASTVLAGVTGNGDGFEGTGDDTKLGPAGVRDVQGIFSQIAKVVIKGMAFGTNTPTTDSFGIVAEQIVAAKVNGTKLAFHAGARTIGDAFFPTTTGPGQNGAQFDFAIREITN